MGIENVVTHNRADYFERSGITYQPERDPAATKSHAMDGEAAQAKHRRLMEWFEQERERQLENRREMALDHDYYDGLQWSWEDAQVLIERNQSPLVYNLVKPTVDWIIGSERRLRVDWRVLPREDSDVEGAGTKTKVLKYLSDVNKSPFQRSRAFEDATKGGLGWTECGVRSNPGEEPIYDRYESWRYLWFDSFGLELDMSDWRYIFRVKSLDLDVAKAYFPDRSGVIERAAFGQSFLRAEEDEDFWYLGEQYSRARDSLFGTGAGATRRVWYTDANIASARRSRVRLFECWYREPSKVKIIEGGPMDGTIYDGRHPGVNAALKHGSCGLIDRTMMRMRVAIFTESAMIYDSDSPYRHNRFPFTPMWCYRRFRDNMPYGPIRNLRDPQDDTNKRASKILFLLSSNRLIADRDAFDDPDDAREEAAKPNAFLLKKKGAEVKFDNGTQLAEAHFKVMEANIHLMQKIGGVNDDNMGRATNAQSGEAIKARQSEGALQTLGIFDNKRLATQLSGEKILSLAEQFMTQPKVIRLTGHRGVLDWVKINQPEYDEATGQVRWLNDITASQADFVVDEQDYHASMREALFEEMMALIQKLPPEVGLKLLDMVVDLIDIPGKKALVDRIRKMTGMSSPEDEQNPSPEKRREMEQAAAEQAEQAQMARDAAILALSEQAAKVQKLLAEVDKLRAEALAVGGGEPGNDPEAQALREEVAGLTTELTNRRDEIIAEMDQARMENERAAVERMQADDHKAAEIGAKERMHAAELASKERLHKLTLQSNEKTAALDRKVKEATEKAKAKAAKAKKPAAKK